MQYEEVCHLPSLMTHKCLLRIECLLHSLHFRLCENLKINQCKPNCQKIHARATCISEGEGAVCNYKEGTRMVPNYLKPTDKNTDSRGRSPTKRSPNKHYHNKKHSPVKYSQQSNQDREYHMNTKVHKEDCSAEDWNQRVLLAGSWLRTAHYEGRYMG